MWLINLSHIPDLLHHAAIFQSECWEYSAIFQNKIPPIFTFFQKYLLRNFWYEVRHYMIKSASIVRNLSKIYTFRTIASKVIYPQSQFPANFNWAKPPFPRNLIYVIPPFPINLAEFYNINSAIAGVKNHHCWV